MARPATLGALLVALSPWLLAGCGAGGSSPSQGADVTITDTAAVSAAARSCPAAALEAIDAVAQRVYQESANGRIVAQALERLRNSSALARAVETNDRIGARRVLNELLLNQIVSVRVTKGARTLARIERGAGIAPRSEPLVGAGGRAVGQVTVSVQGANGYAQTLAGLLHAQVVVDGGEGPVTATLSPAPKLAKGTREATYNGVRYRVDTFAASGFPDRPLRVSLLTPTGAIDAVCAKHGASAAQAEADTLGLVAERVYYAEHEGTKAKLLLHYVERSRRFRAAVLTGNPKTTRAAIIGFFRSHLHIVRVRVLRAGKLLVDVGGPYVLAPIPGVIRGADGRVAARFLLAIQDDLGFQILAHAFTGAQVVMREGPREVMGTLKPGPAAIPDRGRLAYQGATYQAYSFMARAFPSGPLRISLLFAVG